MDGVRELLARADVVATLTAVGAILLGTLSMVLLLEALRGWSRERRATRALRKVQERGAGARTAVQTGLLHEASVRGPKWLQAVVLRLPHREDLRRLLEQAGRPRWSLGSVLIVCLGSALVAALLTGMFAPGVGPLLLGAIVGASLPIVYLRRMRSKRFARFEEHFAEAIDLLARAARAGHSLAAGFEVVARESEDPVASEFRRVYDEQRFGLPMPDALLGLADRIDLGDVRIFTTAVLIQRESGGNLAENLDKLSEVIRLRFRFRRDVRTKTAHGRITGTVVALAPVVAGLGMYALNPTYMEPLISEPLGRMMLLVGLVMMAMGFFVIRRMVDIRV